LRTGLTGISRSPSAASRMRFRIDRQAIAPGSGPRQLGDERGDCRGNGLALLCFPMSVRKEVYEEPCEHRQPG
jgi:hypothetical protein